MLKGKANHGCLQMAQAVRELYQQGQSDYSLEPVVVVDSEGQPRGRIQDGDAVIFCCRRGEREIQLTEAFVDQELAGFTRQLFSDLIFVPLTLYHEKFKDLPVAFAPRKVEETLGEIASRAGLRQLRVAESEKFAHVTFFFNGGHNLPFPGEDQVRIPSLRGIPFDQAPALRLPEITQKVLEGIGQRYNLIIANFANGDVIGHTQNRRAKVQCAEEVDTYLGQIVGAAQAAGYVVMVTADHGNLEEMILPDGSDHVAHTTNPVPFILIDPHPVSPVPLQNGILADVAPTILSALGLPPSPGMTGCSLAGGYAWGGRRQVLLLILDGWGIGELVQENPIYQAPTPTWDRLVKQFPMANLAAYGEAVGLKPGKAGNSEAGHMNLGAGRIVLQDDVRLDQAMLDGSFFTNEIFLHTFQTVRERRRQLHLIGLLTEKSSHGSIDYPLALLRMAKANGLEDVCLHLIFDGRSTEPGSAPALLEKLEAQMEAIGIGQVVTGVGRGLALDRDGSYHKTQRAYDAMVYGKGRPCPNILLKHPTPTI